MPLKSLRARVPNLEGRHRARRDVKADKLDVPDHNPTRWQLQRRSTAYPCRFGLVNACPAGNRLGRQRGFRGGTQGPAGPCRSLSPLERQAVEDELRRAGRL
jgi:hypothetical protein